VLQLELEDIQGLIARGYGDLKAASYVLLQIDDAVSARSWLARVAQEVSPAAAHPEEAALNLAITARGMQKLGLSASALRLFSYEFRTGMTTAHRRRMLGDVGADAPEHWLWGGPSTPAVDLLLLVFARDPATLEQRYASISSGFRDGGVTEILHLETVVDLDGKEHFGFTDGISQPTIAGLSSRVDVPPNTVASGEFILGYVNAYGRYTDRPLLESSADPSGILPHDVEGSGKADLGRNGTYLVFRHLSQDVSGFWRFVDQATSRADGMSHPEARTWLAAKMVGRWPSGAPLTLAPDADDPKLAGANDFTYHYADELGLNCPIGAHVRRAHPRDSLDPAPGTVRSVAIDKRHRLLRRGREYGPPVDDVFGPAPPNDADRGLYFICLVGNIGRQFEFVQHTWLNNPKFDELYDEPDPLVANHAAVGATFSVPADPVRIRYADIPNFVTVRGGGYFFLPGLGALRYLANLSPS
jgi:Dyp-type peroxidase family